MRSVDVTSRWLLLAMGVGVVLGGCGSEAPQSIPTYPATGSVLLADGQPLRGGMIEFRCLDNASITTNSVIDDDGGFTLMTMLDGQRVDGAVVGEYRVTVIAPLGETSDVQAVGTTFSIPDTYQVSADGDNAFAITLPVSP